MNEPILHLEQQVVSYELAVRLRELGVNQTSLFYHHNGKILTWWEMRGRTISEENEQVAAHTASELMEELPRIIEYKSKEYALFITKASSYNVYIGSYCWEAMEACSLVSDSLTECLAQLYVYLLENNLITLPLSQ